eukprot:759574-Hanusia_phi.AAC.16
MACVTRRLLARDDSIIAGGQPPGSRGSAQAEWPGTVTVLKLGPRAARLAPARDRMPAGPPESHHRGAQ